VAWLLERPEVAPPQAEVAEPPPDGDLDWEISVETVAGFPGAVRARRIPPCPTVSHLDVPRFLSFSHFNISLYFAFNIFQSGFLPLRHSQSPGALQWGILLYSLNSQFRCDSD